MLFVAALIDPEAKVRAQATIPHAFPHIIGVYCEGGFLDGEGIRFSDNLNCFIGGRGTGKSTAIRSLAYALGIDDEFAEFENCPDLIVVYCEDANGIVYRYERLKGSAPSVRAREDQTITEEVPPDAFRIEVYKQGALAEVARDPPGNSPLLQDFLDEHIALEDLQSREASLLEELEQNSAVLKPLEASATQLATKRAALDGFNSKLKAAESGKVKEIAALQNRLAAEKNLVRSLDQIREFYERGAVSVSPLLKDYDALSQAAGTPTTDPQCGENLKQAKEAIESANALLKTHEQKMRSELKQVGQKLATALAALRIRHGQLEQQIEGTVEKLRKQGLAASVSELNALIRQRDTISSEVARITGQQSELTGLRTARNQLLSDLSDVRGEVADRRRGQCSTINANFRRTITDYFVSLYYDPVGNSDEFCSLVLSVMHGTYLPEESARVLCGRIEPLKLAELIRQKDIKSIAETTKIEAKWASELVLRFGLIRELTSFGDSRKTADAYYQGSY